MQATPVAVVALKKTIGLYLERGRFRQAADRQSAQTCLKLDVECADGYSTPCLPAEEVAQIYQQDGSDLQAAMEAYEQSGEWYAGEDSTAFVMPTGIGISSTNTC